MPPCALCARGCPLPAQPSSAASLWRRLWRRLWVATLLIATVIVHFRNDTEAREAETEAGQKPEDDQQILGGGPQDRVAAIRHV